jgi:hypothetical protein
MDCLSSSLEGLTEKVRWIWSYVGCKRAALKS